MANSMGRALAPDNQRFDIGIYLTAQRPTPAFLSVSNPLMVLIIVKIELVRVYSARFDEPPIEHDGPDDEQRRRDYQSEQSCLRWPAEEEAVSPRGSKKHHK